MGAPAGVGGRGYGNDVDSGGWAPAGPLNPCPRGVGLLRACLSWDSLCLQAPSPEPSTVCMKPAAPHPTPALRFSHESALALLP